MIQHTDNNIESAKRLVTLMARLEDKEDREELATAILTLLNGVIVPSMSSWFNPLDNQLYSPPYNPPKPHISFEDDNTATVWSEPISTDNKTKS